MVGEYQIVRWSAIAVLSYYFTYCHVKQTEYTFFETEIFDFSPTDLRWMIADLKRAHSDRKQLIEQIAKVEKEFTELFKRLNFDILTNKEKSEVRKIEIEVKRLIKKRHSKEKLELLKRAERQVDAIRYMAEKRVADEKERQRKQEEYARCCEEERRDAAWI